MVNNMAGNSIWDEFDKAIDTEALAKDVGEAGENGDFEDVPHDTYEVAITKLELTKSKGGDPMLTCWMKIVEGDYKDSLIFMNQVISQDLPAKTQRFQRHKIDKFLRSLVSEMDEPIDVYFKTFKQYGNMIMNIAEAIDNNFEYLLDYSANPKKPQYSDYEIKEVYVLED